MATNFGNRLCIGYQNWMPTLVFTFTAWLTQGSLLGVKWLPIKVANTSKIDKFEWFIARQLEMAPSDYINF